MRFGQSLFQIVLVFLLIHRIQLLAIPVALAVAASVGLATFFIREYSSVVHSSDELFRDQWRWFWLPLLGSMGLAAGMAVALRPQTMVAAVLAVALYWAADGCFLLAINKTLRREARQFFIWMFATASVAAAR